MSENTNIEWCDATINWWAGCTKVSPACDKCYAERMAGRLWKTQWGAGEARTQFLGADEALRTLDRKAKRMGRPLMVFHNSLSDFFDKEVPAQWRFSAMRAMVETPNLIHLLLTKRIGNAADMLETAFRAVHGQREGWRDNVRANIWIGATVVNQEEADRDIPKLLAVPAAKRFLSMEPLLGPVSLRWAPAWPENAPTTAQSPSGTTDHLDGLRRLDWVIVGGESGPGARPMLTDWARSLRDQCETAGVPFLFKQWGEFVEPEQMPEATYEAVDKAHNLAGHGRYDLPWGVGKKAAGRELDGRTWDGFPA